MRDIIKLYAWIEVMACLSGNGFDQQLLTLRLQSNLIALATGMKSFGSLRLRWPGVMYGEGLTAVRAKLRGGRMGCVPMTLELTDELKRFPVVISDDQRFAAKSIGSVAGVAGTD